MATLACVPNPVPSPREDAKKIRKAVKAFYTDEKAIISILGHRNAAQRNLIRKTYEDLYNEVLMKRLWAELDTGDFERALCQWMRDPVERDAIMARVASKNLNCDYKVIVEIACELSPDDLLAVKREYQNRYKCSLEEDVASHTTGNLRAILVALVGTYRYDGNEVDTIQASSDANILHSAINAKAFNHEDVIRILTTRSKAQLNATFNRYRDAHSMSITKKLLGEPADGFVEALKTTARCISDPVKYYEKVIRNAINKKGDYEDSLTRVKEFKEYCYMRNSLAHDKAVITRVIVRHAETNLKEMKELYYKRNSVALDEAVAKATSGDYKAFLLTLLGREGY